MKSSFFVCLGLSLISAFFAWRSRAVVAQPAVPAVTTVAGLELTGPYAFQNLAIFLVHDKQAAQHQDVLTLEEALARKVVTVEETGNVNKLLASNKGDKSVFIQSGDIVKGGQQDRVLQHDVVLPPRSSKVPLNAFCVEAGRWHGRGNEPVRHFASSSATIVTRKQKAAVKLSADQGAVWSSVAESQAALGKNLGRSVQAPDSQSSLQLSLEDRNLNQTVGDYVRGIEKQLPTRPDVVGYAVAVNGEVSTVDVFASSALFGKLKGKLLKAGAAEAIAERRAAPVPPAKIEDVRALLSDAETGTSRTERQTLRTHVGRKETAQSAVFTTDDPLVPSKAVHRSYLKK
jgi:hypothetical protein